MFLERKAFPPVRCTPPSTTSDSGRQRDGYKRVNCPPCSDPVGHDTPHLSPSVCYRSLFSVPSVFLSNMGAQEVDGNSNQPQFEIPKQCKAGVVVNEGPDFHVEVQMVDVPE